MEFKSITDGYLKLRASLLRFNAHKATSSWMRHMTNTKKRAQALRRKITANKNKLQARRFPAKRKRRRDKKKAGK